MSSIKDVFAVIMAGGKGTRLHPLTLKRSKPAVPIGGKYRLIDIPISNCINSGIGPIAVLTQYNSASLHRHLASAYNQYLHRPLEILAASQTCDSEDWYLGTADAMRKQMAEITNEAADYTLILAGDHIYRMDYEAMLDFHIERKADITVAVHPVGEVSASRLGLIKHDPCGRVTRFVEKTNSTSVKRAFLNPGNPSEPYLASMGIYIFNTRVLVDILSSHPEYVDFGGDVLPAAIDSLPVYAYEFEGYWEDIGTIRAYYDVNLALARPDPPFEFYTPKFPIYSYTGPLPNSMVINSELTHVILSEGCEIRDARISHSVIGPQTLISRGVRIRNSLLLGSDGYAASVSSTIPLGIGEGSSIEGAIVDKNARIGREVVIRPFPCGMDFDSGSWSVCDGIVVIPKDAEIADGAVLAPDAPLFTSLALPSLQPPQFEILPRVQRVEKVYARVGGRNGH